MMENEEVEAMLLHKIINICNLISRFNLQHKTDNNRGNEHTNIVRNMTKETKYMYCGQSQINFIILLFNR